MNIEKFVVWAELDRGIYREERDAEARRVEFASDQAHLALAEAYMATQAVANSGAYGSIGCGILNLAAVIDGDEHIITSTDDDALDYDAAEIEAAIANLPEGELTREEIRDVSGSVWDGNNHVSLEYPDIEQYAAEDEDDIEFYQWGTLTYETDDNGWRHTCGCDIKSDWEVVLAGGNWYHVNEAKILDDCLSWANEHAEKLADHVGGKIAEYVSLDEEDSWFLVWRRDEFDHLRALAASELGDEPLIDAMFSWIITGVMDEQDYSDG